MVVIKNANGSIEVSVGSAYYGHGAEIIIKPATRKKKAKPATKESKRRLWVAS